ncbi:hypothetical protein ACKWTF_003192 [Chironomus riparius]
MFGYNMTCYTWFNICINTVTDVIVEFTISCFGALLESEKFAKNEVKIRGTSKADSIDLDAPNSLGVTYSALKRIFIGAKTSNLQDRDQKIKESLLMSFVIMS